MLIEDPLILLLKTIPLMLVGGGKISPLLRGDLVECKKLRSVKI